MAQWQMRQNVFCNFCLVVAPKQQILLCFYGQFRYFSTNNNKTRQKRPKIANRAGQGVGKTKGFRYFPTQFDSFHQPLPPIGANRAMLLFGADIVFVILLLAVGAPEDIRRRWMVARVQKAFSTFFDKNRHKATENKVLSVPQNTFFDTIRQHSAKSGKVPQKQTKFDKLLQKSTNFCHIAQMLPF